MKAYKVFDKDWTCQGYDFKTNNGSAIGSKHVWKGELKLCPNLADIKNNKGGFHFCRKLSNCFSYKEFNSENKVAEVEIIGDFIGDPENKECTKELEIIREITWEEVLRLCNSGNGNSGNRNSGNGNSGNRNSGHWNSGNGNSGNKNSGNENSGNRNSGDRNSGDENSGHWNSGNGNSGNRNSGNKNSGHWNSGHWNSGNGNSGYLNTNQPDKIRIFNKWITKEEYENIKFPNFFYFGLTQWISHDLASREEKKKYKKEMETCGGFLKTIDYKTAWRISYKKANEKDKEKVKNIPGFDKDLFYEITGIMIEN